MLLRFGLSNFRSIGSFQEINLAASKLSDAHVAQLRAPGTETRFLPVIAIYGPNASGKTNLLLGFDYFIDAIIHSHTRGDRDTGFARQPFKLDPEIASRPSEFSCDFSSSVNRYTYGFKIDDAKVLEEWLYSYPRGRRRILFSRTNAGRDEYVFGTYLKGQNRVISELTRQNSLFLSAAVKNNHGALTEVYNVLVKDFRFLNLQESTIELLRYSAETLGLEDSEKKNFIVSFLKAADIGICDMSIEKDPNFEKNAALLKKLVRVLEEETKLEKGRASATDESNDITIPQPVLFKFMHTAKNKDRVPFDVSQESRGTRRLFSLLVSVFDAIKHGRALLVDEFDSSLHPLLSQKIIKIFNSPKANQNGGQLIFSTHDTALLGRNILRRDQVWLTEKTRTGETRLSPLTDYLVHKKDSIEKGYLQGRFGAVPFLEELDEVVIKHLG